MELLLNIYDEKDNVVKTYTREGYSIKMRLLKDIISMIDFEILTSSFQEDTTESNMLFVKLVTDLVVKSYDTIQELMKKVFVELTDEEYLNTAIDEVVQIIIDLVKYSFATIGIVGKNTKN